MAGVPEFADNANTRLVMRLLVKVSVVARATSVSVEVGRVSVPVLTIELNEGVVRAGDVERTLEPEPVDVVTPVPPLTTGSTLINWSALLVATMYHCEPL